MSWQSLNLAAPEFDERPEPPSLCGLVYERLRHLVSGPPEAAKTLFSLIVGLEEMRRGGTLAVVDFESGPHATRRTLAELGASLDEISRVVYFEPDSQPDHFDIESVVNASVTLAVIDAAAGAYGVSGLDDNKRQDAETFGLDWIDPLWRAGVATMLVDHVTKNAESRGKFSIGSERKVGRTDVHLGLEAVTQLSRGRDGLIKIRTHKDRPGWLTRPQAAELHLHSDPDTHEITWEFVTSTSDQTGDDGFTPTVIMERVADFLGEQTEPASRNQIESAGLGKQAIWVRRALDELVSQGRATETAGPRGARLYRLTSSSSDLVSPRLDEDEATSSDLVSPSKGTRSETRSSDEVIDRERAAAFDAMYPRKAS